MIGRAISEACRRPAGPRGRTVRATRPGALRLACLVLFAAAAGLAPASSKAAESYSHGRFDDVELHRPPGPPTQVVLMMSGTDGWTDVDRRRAASLSHLGAVVAGIDLQRLRRRFAADACLFPDGDFENLSHHLQAYLRLGTYLKPVLAGRGQGASLAYAMAAQTVGDGFGGLLTWDFCPALDGPQPLCRGDGVHFRRIAPARARQAGASGTSAPAAGASKSRRPAPGASSAMPGSPTLPPVSASASASASASRALAASAVPVRPAPAPDGLELLPAERIAVPWYSISTPAASCAAAVSSDFVGRVQGAHEVGVDPPGPPSASSADASPGEERGLQVAYERLRSSNRPALPPPPERLSDLPLIEVPSASGAPATRRFAVFLSGDGGWANIDKAISAALAREGVPVVGFDSLRYFWKRRTPQGLANDLDRIVRYYAARWQRDEVVLIGFSQGADVLPFAINRLPPASRAMLHRTALLGLAQKASFEFHLSNWLGPSGDEPVEPEARRLVAAETLCVHGSEEQGSLCPLLPATSVTAVRLRGDHHFAGDYEGVARLILEHASRR